MGQKIHSDRAKKLAKICLVVGFCMTSCTSTIYVPYPYKHDVAPGEKLPIDGRWVNEKNARFRIWQGIMFVDDPGIDPPLKNGQVVAKSIRQISSTKYTLYAGSHNVQLRLADFGRGEIEVISDSSLLFRTYPNEKTRLWKTTVVKFHVSELDDPDRFMAQLRSPESPLSKEGLHTTSPLESGVDLTEQGIGERWAVIIGISSYQDSRIPSLRYAIKDAQAFYQWLVSKDGGRYAPSKVNLLLNADATGENIRNSLFEWLKQALEEDMVTIYFAGHGSADSPDSPKNLFLFPYDTKYESISSTGFPMWDIETALKRFIKAKKVVVLADACHAGGIGQSFDIARRANRGLKVNPISSGITNLSNVSDGVAIFSASADNQYSQESKDWGGGHGVFTYFLLKGLKGNADFNKDGRVNLGELNLYLSEQIRRATKNAQTPIVSGKFDPGLTIGK